MGLELLVDRLGEPSTAVLGGLLIGLLFGAMAQRSRFCMRSAVIEFSEGTLGAKVAIWLLAFGAAVALTQLVLLAGVADLSAARQLAPRASVSGAILGGLMVGAGMILTRGCPSRLLVLSANGNLRALLSGLVFAVVAQASLRGALAPVRDGLAGLWVVEGPEVADLLSLLRLDHRSGLAIGLVAIAVAAVVGARNRIGPWGWIGGAGVGTAVAAAWWFTGALAAASFEPMPIKSISFSGPSADMLMLVLAPSTQTIDFDTGLVPGVFLGSFLAALLARELELQGFKDGQSMRRYILGAAMMGFGAMLAGGCAVGAGVSGGAVFATAAWLALFFMWVGAGLTHWLVDRERSASADFALAAR
ncbi:MAG: YeeE/YedE family protein [Geminicoccaceae bacterium]|nr:YeeE/YedE family protein [Geminicoccaceae bacterium]MDW8368685.1 YeeE/YedE family protein [Geminicoccaceae bacterium]